MCETKPLSRFLWLSYHCIPVDPTYQHPVPNLDGCEGHSEHILFGTNVDISEDKDTEGGGQGATQTQPEAGGGNLTNNQRREDSKL